MKVLTIIALLIVSTMALPQSRNPRIWNGDNATPGQAPFMIGLLWYETVTTTQPINFCGGAILNAWWVITAAHCLDNNLVGIGRFEVVVGQHFVSIPNRLGREQFRDLALQVFHPNYIGGASAYDIALIRVDRALQLNQYVQAASLPPQAARPPQSGQFDAFGWGSTSGEPPHSLPDQLQTTPVSVTTYEICRELIDAVLPGSQLSTSCMCTLPLANRGNVCNADSGGPAVVNGVVVAVLSWGAANCSNRNVPTVWSGLAPARNWIDATMAANPAPL